MTPKTSNSNADATPITFCSKLQAILILSFLRATVPHGTRRSLNNIFNRTHTVQTSNATGNSSTSLFTLANTTSNDVETSRKETSDITLAQLRRRLGVGLRRPSDDFIDGNESMHRFFDKMLMSMTTEVRFQMQIFC